MIVSDIMTTNVVALDEDMSFLDAVKLFLAYNISGAPVVTNFQELIGVVSEKDLLRAMYPTYHDFYTDPHYYLDKKEMDGIAKNAKDKKIKHIMSGRVITTTPQTHILKAGGQMVATGIHRVPVVEQNRRLVGMVSRRDIYRALLQEKFQISTVGHAL